ncbi:hypothetical protein OSTOST_03928 [Ostertagia ostertagi]
MIARRLRMCVARQQEDVARNRRELIFFLQYAATTFCLIIVILICQVMLPRATTDYQRFLWHTLPYAFGYASTGTTPNILSTRSKKMSYLRMERPLFISRERQGQADIGWEMKTTLECEEGSDRVILATFNAEIRRHLPFMSRYGKTSMVNVHTQPTETRN